MVGGDSGGAQQECVCTLGLEECTHCLNGCTESDFSLDEFNFDDGTYSEEFMLNQVEDGPSTGPLFEEVLG